MGTIITPCCACPTWVDKALAKVSQFEELEMNQDQPDPESFRREIDDAVASVSFQDVTQFINPTEWGKKGKRPVALPQGVKNRAQKGVQSAVKGFHISLPV